MAKNTTQSSPVTKPLSERTMEGGEEFELLSEAGVLRKFPFLTGISGLFKSPVFAKVIHYLTRGKNEKDKTDTTLKVFNQVTLRQYRAINQIIESSVLENKFRLTHIASERLLIIEMTRSAHEAPLIELNRVFVPLIDQLPFDYTLVRPTVEMNSPLSSPTGKFHALPDFAVRVARQSGIRLSPEIICIGECAFSQREDVVLKKLQHEVNAHPENVMVLMILITEAAPYHSPNERSVAWNTFLCHPQCPNQQEFLAMMENTDDACNYLGPVTVAGHSWCKISNIDYYVWVKDGEEKISINIKGEAGTMAHGTLFPQINMGQVDDMIEQGLLKIRDAIVNYSNGLDPDADTSVLSATDVPWSFDWSRCQIGIANAAECTAHERFMAWYMDNFRGTKRSYGDVDSSNDGSDTNSSDSSPASVSQLTPPRTRARVLVAAKHAESQRT